MNREEFLDRLEYLLQDIPEEEKRDALDYYRDYLDEAGPDNEESVLQEFGSPERIASILRTDLMGGMAQAGEFTDHGFEDRRFEQKAYPAVKPGGDSGEKDSSTGEGETEERSAGGRGRSYSHSVSGKRSGNWVKYLLIAFLILILAPFMIAVGAGLTGGFVGVLSLLLVLILVLALLTFCGFLGGAVMLVVGIGFLFTDPWLGAACIGVGLIGLGIGCLLFICAYLFYGKFLPWAVMGIVNFAGNLLNRNRAAKKDDIGEIGKH